MAGKIISDPAVQESPLGMRFLEAQTFYSPMLRGADCQPAKGHLGNGARLNFSLIPDLGLITRSIGMRFASSLPFESRSGAACRISISNKGETPMLLPSILTCAPGGKETLDPALAPVRCAMIQ